MKGALKFCTKVRAVSERSVSAREKKAVLSEGRLYMSEEWAAVSEVSVCL